MKHYYITNLNLEKGFEEITESEWNGLFGDENTRPYISQVYREEITIDEVPEEYREAVSACVANRVAKFGKYSERDISASEALNIITGGSES